MKRWKRSATFLIASQFTRTGLIRQGAVQIAPKGAGKSPDYADALCVAVFAGGLGPEFSRQIRMARRANLEAEIHSAGWQQESAEQYLERQQRYAGGTTEQIYGGGGQRLWRSHFDPDLPVMFGSNW